MSADRDALREQIIGCAWSDREADAARLIDAYAERVRQEALAQAADDIDHDLPARTHRDTITGWLRACAAGVGQDREETPGVQV